MFTFVQVLCKVAVGRSHDDEEIVTSYGRRRRRSANPRMMGDNEEGDILSMTMLTKSLIIKPQKQNVPSFGDVQSTQPPRPSSISTPADAANKRAPSKKVLHHHMNNKTKANRPTIVSVNHQSKEFNSPSAINLDEKQKKSFDLVSTYFKVHIGDKGYFCFDPVNLFVLCCFMFCLQGFIFSLIFYFLIRIKLISYRNKQLSLIPRVSPYSHSSWTPHNHAKAMNYHHRMWSSFIVHRLSSQLYIWLHKNLPGEM